jgi:hypothetical protein
MTDASGTTRVGVGSAALPPDDARPPQAASATLRQLAAPTRRRNIAVIDFPSA